MEQSTALHREPQNKQSIEPPPENPAPHSTASSWVCCQNSFTCSVVFAEGEGGNDVARAAQTDAFGSPVPPENPWNTEWRARMKAKPIKHCAHRSLRLVPKSVKAGPAMCAQQPPSSSFPSAKGHKPLLKEIFLNQKDHKNCSRGRLQEACKKRNLYRLRVHFVCFRPFQKGEQDINLIYSASYMRFMPSSYHQSDIKQPEVHR